MISKNTIKFLKSLQIKKYRNKESVFLVEGAKNVLEVLKSDYKLRDLYVSERFLEQHQKDLLKSETNYHLVNENELSNAGSLKTNQMALAVVEMKHQVFNSESDGISLVLDDISDPGNLGTIIRIADWYGISQVVCSLHCADLYNPKVIAASMGSFSRINVPFCNLENLLKQYDHPVMGAFMEGQNVHDFSFPKTGLVVIGNESNGISKALSACVTHKITIPRYGSAESLNAGIATAVICDNFRRY